jgi:hypothetical protein
VIAQADILARLSRRGRSTRPSALFVVALATLLACGASEARAQSAPAPVAAAGIEWDPWYVLLPIDQPGGAANVAEPRAAEDELQRHLPGREGPDLTRIYPGKVGVAAGWRAVDEALITAPVLALAAMDLTKLSPKDVPTNDASAYLYRRVRAKSAAVVTASLGYDDAARVWLNGKLVIQGCKPGAFEPLADTLQLELQAGDNHLLAKVTNGGGAWRFRLLPSDARPLAGRAAAQEKVNAAIERGCKFLISRQLRDGSWAFDDQRFPGGMTALAVYALLKSGVPLRHQAVQRGVAYLRGRPTEHTYTASCVLLMLWALHEEANQEWAADVADELISWDKSGVWGYPHDEPDLSNTQYAALGLLAAARLGIEIPAKVWRDIIAQVPRYQGKHGGFGYRISDTGNPTGSMTAAGISAVAIARNQLSAQAGKGAQGLSLAEPSLEAGARWLTSNLQITGSPVANRTERPNGHRGPYYLYGLERACTLLGLERLGGVDWYWEGANWFLEVQNDKGAFTNGYDEDEPNTCFGLLFLSRATASFTGKAAASREDIYQTDDGKSAVFVRATGNSQLAVWLAGFSDQTLQAHAWQTVTPKGLRVSKVEYLVDGAVVASLAGDAGKTWAGDKFPTQLRFARGGIHQVAARVHLMLEPSQAGGDPGSAVVDSEVLEVNVTELVEPALLEQASAARRNLIVADETRASASTQFSDSPAAAVIDGRESSGWTSMPEDKSPVLTLEFERPVRANRLALSPLGGRSGALGEWDRATRVEVRINKQEIPTTLELEPEELRVTLLELPKTTLVRSLEVRILERIGGLRFPGRVGFNEVGLYFDGSKAGKGPAGKEK